MPVSNEKISSLRFVRPDYKWKVQTASEYGCQLVAYVDARIVADILDDTVGPANWQCKYEEVSGVVYCSIGILTESGWVWKQDAGTESNMDKEKGQASDAFKRAAVRWGVCRFLYDLSIIKIREVIKNKRGKFVPAHNGKQIWDITEHVREFDLDQGPRSKPATNDQREEIQFLASSELGMNGKQVDDELRKMATSWKKLSYEQAQRYLGNLGMRVKEKKETANV